MRILGIDLSTHQVGISIVGNDSLSTQTIKDISKAKKYQIIDSELLQQAALTLIDIIDEQEPDIVLIEYANIIGTPKYLSFCTGIIGALKIYYYRTEIDVICINEARWIAQLKKTSIIRRDSFSKGRQGNKTWLQAIAAKQFPKHNFLSQDEIDATIMVWTYLNHQSKF